MSAVDGDRLGGGDRVTGEASDADLGADRFRGAGSGDRRRPAVAERLQVVRDGGEALRHRGEDDDQVGCDVRGGFLDYGEGAFSAEVGDPPAELVQRDAEGDEPEGVEFAG